MFYIALFSISISLILVKFKTVLVLLAYVLHEIIA